MEMSCINNDHLRAKLSVCFDNITCISLCTFPQRNSFMNGTKKVAIISDAASTGKGLRNI